MASLQGHHHHHHFPPAPQPSTSPLPPYHQPLPSTGEWAIRVSSSLGPLQAHFYHVPTGRSFGLVNRAFSSHAPPQQHAQPVWDLVDMAMDKAFGQYQEQAFPEAPWLLVDHANVRFANTAEESDLPRSLEKLNLSTSLGHPNAVNPYKVNGPLTPPADLPNLQPIHSVDVAGVPSQLSPSPSPAMSLPPPLHRATTQPGMPDAAGNVSRSISRRPIGGGVPARKLAPAPGPDSLPPHQSPPPYAMAPPPLFTSRGVAPVSPQPMSQHLANAQQTHPVSNLAPGVSANSPQQQNYIHSSPAHFPSPGLSATSPPSTFQQPGPGSTQQHNTPQIYAAPPPLPTSQHQQTQQMAALLAQSQQNASTHMVQQVAAVQSPYFAPPPQQHHPVPAQQTRAVAQPQIPHQQAMPVQHRQSIPNSMYPQQQPATQARAAPGGHHAGGPHTQQRPQQQHAPPPVSAPQPHQPQQAPPAQAITTTNNIPGYGGANQPSSTAASSASPSFSSLSKQGLGLSKQGFGKMKKLMKHPAMKSPAAKYAMKLGTGLVVGGLMVAGADGLADSFSGGGGDFSGGGVEDVTFTTEETVTVETETVDVGGGEEVTYTEVDTTTTTTFVESDTSGYTGMETFTTDSSSYVVEDTSAYAGMDTTSQAVAITSDSSYVVDDQLYGYSGAADAAIYDQQQVALANESVNASAAQLGMEYRGQENALALI